MRELLLSPAPRHSPGRRKRGLRASSARVAAATSVCRIRLSPTRKVAIPAVASRARSSGVKMPLSPTITRSAGTSCARRSRGRERRLERVQVPVVDADQPRFQAQRPFKLLLVVHLDQRVHAERDRRRFEFGCAAASSTAAMMIRMQSAPAARASSHLIGVVHEILAQHRQRTGGARRAQVIERALEGGRVGEHRKAGRAACRVGHRQRRRIEVVADQSPRRARLLDLGDQGIVAGRQPPLDRRQEAARRGRGLGLAFERASGRSRFAAAISSRL